MRRTNKQSTEMRKAVLSIAGFDPSGGAGLVADCKTFETLNVLGMSVCTGITYQNDDTFIGVDWLNEGAILKQLSVLQEKFFFEFVKVGIVENWGVLEKVIGHLSEKNPKVKVVLDPVIRASAGYNFHSNNEKLKRLLPKLFLLTPNWTELQELYPMVDPMASARELSQQCNVFLKGGHNPMSQGTDYLFGPKRELEYPAYHIDVKPKHGSGCVLSSAITAFLVQGNSLGDACRMAKEYTFRFLASNEGLLGSHS